MEAQPLPPAQSTSSNNKKVLIVTIIVVTIMLLICFTIGIGFITARLAFSKIQKNTQEETVDTNNQEDSDEPLSYITTDVTNAELPIIPD